MLKWIELEIHVNQVSRRGNRVCTGFGKDLSPMQPLTPAQLDRLNRRTQRELAQPITFGVLVGAALFLVFAGWEAALGRPGLVAETIGCRAGLSLGLAALALAVRGPMRRFPLVVLHVATGTAVAGIGLLAQVLPEPSLFAAGSLMLVLLVHAGLVPTWQHAVAAGLTVLVAFHVAAGISVGHLDRAILAVDFFLVPGVVTMVGLVHLRAQARERAFSLELELEAQAIEDSLTGALSRRGFVRAAEAVVARSLRRSEPVGVLVVDLDHFKSVNDTHGHAVGDAVLREATRAWRTVLRESDLLGRLGGEEFAVLLPLTDLRQAREVADRLRDATSQVRIAAAPGLVVTSSVGVAALRSQESLALTLERADLALYQAKRAGRNRVHTAPEPDQQTWIRVGDRLVMVKAS
jgi:diguanylate cyclase (GGDEF)-like protein